MKRWLIPAIIVVGAFLVTVLVMQSARGVCENTRRREQSIALTQTFFRSVRNGESRTNIEARAAALGLESRGDEPTISYHAPDWYWPPACDGTSYVQITYRAERALRISAPQQSMGPCI